MKERPTWFWAALALLLVLLFNLFATPGFLSVTIIEGRLYGSLIDIINRMAPVGLLSLGMTLVIATRGVDLSVGAIMAISGSVAASLIARPEGNLLRFLDPGGSVPAIVVAALFVGFVCGLFNGWLISAVKIQPIVATLLLMVAGRGAAQLLTDGQIITFQHAPFAAIGSGATAGLPNPFWLLVLATVTVLLLTRGTALGTFIDAVGANPVAARNVGLRTGTVILTVYAISGICAALAGLIGTADIQAADANNAGLYLELDAILAVSVGGTLLSGGRFSLVGSLVGTALMQALTTTILTRGVTPEMTMVIKALVVLLVCLLQAPAFHEFLRHRRVAA